MSKSDEQLEQDGRRKQKAESRKTDRFKSKRSGFVADWAGVDAELLKRCIATVAAAGGAIRLGYTRDGGAYALGVYSDGDCENVYVGSEDDIVEVLENVRQEFEK